MSAEAAAVLSHPLAIICGKGVPSGRSGRVQERTSTGAAGSEVRVGDLARPA
jgi:hypothetical protein